MIFLAGVERYGFRGKLRLLRFCYFRWCLFRLGNFRLLNGNGLFSLRLCPALRLRFLQKNGAQHGSGVRPRQSEVVYALFPMHLRLKAAS